MLKAESARKLAAYVEQGGILISEGLPGYFGDRGKVGTVQPNHGLDRVFGAVENYVEFTPDLLENLNLTVRGAQIPGRYFLQAYRPTGGTVAGNYSDGQVAAVEYQFGKGRTLLIGTFPGGGYYLHHSAPARAFFAGLLDWAKVQPRVKSDSPGTQSRLHTGTGGTYLWVVNPARAGKPVTVDLSAAQGPFEAGEDVWGGRRVTVKGRTVQVEAGDRDVAVVRLK